MDDALMRHEQLRHTYLEAREALVEVLIERIGQAVRHRFPAAEYLNLDSFVLDDGRVKLEASGVRSRRTLEAPAVSREGWEAVAVSILPLLDELGEVAPLDEVASGVLLT